MPSAIQAAGAQSSPSRYAALTQGGREITGLVTHRSPYRDGAVPYEVARFYSGSRFDTMIDGLNREVSNKLTDRRRPGHSVFNANTFPGIASFYSWSFLQDGAEVVRTIADGVDGAVYDATPGQKTSLFTKSAGYGPARFLGVDTELFFGDGVEAKKVLRSAKTWKAATKYSPRNFIIDANQNIQRVRANPVTYTIASIAVVSAPFNLQAVITLTGPAPKMPANQTLSFSGITNYGTLNGQTVMWQPIAQADLDLLNLSPNQIAFEFGTLPYPDTADTGAMIALTATAGTSGAVLPAFSTVLGTVTNDGGTNGGVNWTCFGPAVENWGIDPIAAANDSYDDGPLTYLHDVNRIHFWTPNQLYSNTDIQPIIDPNGNIQLLGPFAAASGNTGPQPPAWKTNVGELTQDRTVAWTNYGRIASWYALANYGGSSAGIANPCAITDPNGNLQLVQDVTAANAAGAAAPAWATGLGATTADGGVTWVNVGAGTLLWSGAFGYAFSFHCIDGSVSTASPVTLVASGGLGIAGGYRLDLSGPNTTDRQCDEIWIWRRALGKSSLILLDIIPNPAIGTAATWGYRDTYSDLQLNPLIPAPIAESNSPPDATMTGPIYHLQRVWAIVANMVVWSGGPDTLTGNGNTAFPPLNFFAYIGRPIALKPVTVQNGGILVFTTRGVYIILGTGTAANPFYSTTYFNKVSILSPNAIELYDNQVFLMEGNGKVSTLAIQYPFDPQTGYTEIGFPIGDQFKKVTTGGISAPLYNPATAYLSWNTEDTDETGMYVADGQVGWFRLGIVMPPEKGFSWSPRAAIAAGTSAVMAIETAPGKSQLLVGPPASTPGPILVRNETVRTDNGAAYPAWDVKGVTLLCSTGQWAEIPHIAAKSAAVGKRPTLSVLFNEIAATAARPWNVLKLAQKSNDPPLNPPSQTVFSDRYSLEQSGQQMTGDCIMTRFDYGTQDAADELLDWGTLASVHNEYDEQADKVSA